MATTDSITDPSTISGLLSIVIPQSKPESVKDLIELHSRFTGLVDGGAFSESTANRLCLTAGDLRFDIARAPAKTAQDVAAKALFFLEDYVDVGPCEEFAEAMRRGLQEDYLRLGGAHVDL